MSPLTAGFEAAHDAFVADRRTQVLAGLLAPLLAGEQRVLDVGCGDAALDSLLLEQRPDLELRGVDVLVRGDAAIPVARYDGEHLPFADDEFDCVLFVDVLHHAASPADLLAEGVRVARRAVVVKDHRRNGWLAGPTLRFMDRVGNRRFGVALPYHYWSHAEWRREIERLGLAIEHWSQDVPLYPPPASWVFGRGLHFVARLGCPGR